MNFVSLEAAVDKLDGWIDEIESAESALDSFKVDADDVDSNITGVLYDHGGCDLDDVANIDIEASELRDAFNGVKEHLPLIQNLNDKIESLEHEVSALQEQLSD
tara:strand:+ start:235 stop:546 length:312 start_codon:yes stop_codon:yes gene_type:complete